MKLSERINKAVEYYEKNGIRYEGAVIAYLKHIVFELRDIEQNQIIWHKWPDDRPPNNLGIYIVVLSNKYVNTARYMYWDDDIGFDFEPMPEEITHWAELPKYEVKE